MVRNSWIRARMPLEPPVGSLDDRHLALIFSGNWLKMANPRQHPHLPAVACWRRSGWMGGRTETCVYSISYPGQWTVSLAIGKPAKAEVGNNVEYTPNSSKGYSS